MLYAVNRSIISFICVALEYSTRAYSYLPCVAFSNRENTNGKEKAPVQNRSLNTPPPQAVIVVEKVESELKATPNGMPPSTGLLQRSAGTALDQYAGDPMISSVSPLSSCVSPDAAASPDQEMAFAGGGSKPTASFGPFDGLLENATPECIQYIENPFGLHWPLNPLEAHAMIKDDFFEILNIHN